MCSQLATMLCLGNTLFGYWRHTCSQIVFSQKVMTYTLVSLKTHLLCLGKSHDPSISRLLVYQWSEMYFFATTFLLPPFFFFLATEMQIKTTMKYYVTPVRMVIFKKSTKSKCWRVCGEKGTLLHCW